MFELKVVTRFAAAHQLKMVGAKCENLHGHNWKIEVYVGGKELNKAGVLVDFGDIKKYVAEIMNRIDHKFLNELELFNDNIPPSSENIALYIGRTLQDKIDNSDLSSSVRVTRVAAWESEDACATYIAD
ncbi:6-carboxytetrahydropterin synthase QueD [Desulfobacterales bacterium HSG17]|nr:6-carboxytetrahydropterin synthase QueD [Desulfobacterales bacterium HSG17]